MATNMYGPGNGPLVSDDGRTVLTGDGGPIDEESQWEETVDVSDDLV